MNNNNIFVFPSDKIKELKSLPRTRHTGYVYALSWGDTVKIGKTTNPYARLNNLQSLADKYANIETGLVAISPPHTNFSENECAMHRIFNSLRVRNGELFTITFLEAVTAMQSLTFLDESEKLEREHQESFAAIKRALKYNWERPISEKSSLDIEPDYKRLSLGSLGGLDLATSIQDTAFEFDEASSEREALEEAACSIDVNNEYIAVTKTEYYKYSDDNWNKLCKKFGFKTALKSC